LDGDTVTTLYLVRHCRAAGQAPDAPLTEEGLAQAERLADFLVPLGPDRIVSSPFRRAVQSVEPLAAHLGRPIELDDRLRERELTSAPLAGDWLEPFRRSFAELDAVLEGGESTRAAMARAAAAIEDALAHGARSTVIASHGNLSTLILRHFDGRAGFDEWRAMTNPDVFRIVAGRPERIWS
jgi:2,3-bisphosphoglycerate-dependent phosphoglycerate mutase